MKKIENQDQQTARALASLIDWSDFAEELKGIGEAVIGATARPDDSQSRQESWKILLAELVRGYLVSLHADPAYPEFVPSYNLGLNLAAPNPDFIYTSTPLDGSGIYRLRGFKGTNLFTWVQFTTTNFIDPAVLKKDGGFEHHTVSSF